MLKSYNSFPIKYRPKKLEDMVGQEASINILKGMFARKKIARSMLIFGESGTGKTTIARMIALYVNCLGKHPPCGSCSSCERGIESHPDVHEINMGDKTGVDYMRDIINSASYKPQSNFRVFILDEVHAVTKNSLSAFLKPLEEPPKNTIWLLVTTAPEKLLETIYGRCLKLPMKPVMPEETVKLLKRVCKLEHLRIKDKILLDISQTCNGQPRDSLQGLEAVSNYFAVDGNRKVKGKELLKIIRQTTGHSDDELAIKFLLSVYLGKYTSSIRAVQEAINLESFIRIVSDYHINTCYRQVSDKLGMNWSKYLNFFKQMDEHKVELSKEISFFILNELTDVANKIRYAIDAKQLLIATTFKMVAVCSKRNRRHYG